MFKNKRNLSVILLILLIASPVLAAPDAASVFQQRWQQHDQLVANRQANRSWTWGPNPITEVIREQYYIPETYEWRERQVQYYDKGRMEINDPDADPSSLWYVTSGRLPIDLMLAPTRYRPFRQWKDAYITAIGDYGSFPTYLDLQPLYESPGKARPERLNQPATDLIEPDLTISQFTDYVNDNATTLRQGQNNHLVPQGFIDFMTQQGPMLRNGKRVNAQIYDPLYIFGLPMTPAVWVRAQVGGVIHPVLFQVFERRVLTYTPDNPAAFRVEMGNVGSHYHNWLNNPATAREFDYEPQDGSKAIAKSDAQVIYTVEVEEHLIAIGPPGSPADIHDSATYRIYQSLDSGQTRELRYTGQLGPGCWSVLFVKLLLPRNVMASPNRIGLMTACAQSPSDARGYGIDIYSSYDDARSFFQRGSD